MYICGLAWDYCVGASALHGLELGFRTVVLEDCIRGIDFETIRKAKETFLTSKGVIVDSDRVRAMVAGEDRLPQLGYKLAQDLKNNKIRNA